MIAHTKCCQRYTVFFQCEILGTYLLLLRKKFRFFSFQREKKRRKKIRTLKNATTKKERKRTKKEIRFSFSIPKFIYTFEKNNLAFLKWPVSEKIASEQPNFDTQIHWQVFIKNYIIWVCRFFPIPAGEKTEKKKQKPENPPNFFCTFFSIFFCFFSPRTKKKTGNFPFFFWVKTKK